MNGRSECWQHTIEVAIACAVCLTRGPFFFYKTCSYFTCQCLYFLFQLKHNSKRCLPINFFFWNFYDRTTVFATLKIVHWHLNALDGQLICKQIASMNFNLSLSLPIIATFFTYLFHFLFFLSLHTLILSLSPFDCSLYTHLQRKNV